MNNSNFLVIYKKSCDGWSLHIGGGMHENIHGLPTKEYAKDLFETFKRFYNHGRYDEFVDNNNKTNKLMERFGL